MNKTKKIVKKEDKSEVKGKILTSKSEYEIKAAPDHSLVYTDNTQVSVGLFDIKLTFGISQGRNAEGQTRIMAHTTLAMSPQHAKAVMMLLQNTVEQYEKLYMPLNFYNEDDAKAEFEEE